MLFVHHSGMREVTVAYIGKLLLKNCNPGRLDSA